MPTKTPYLRQAKKKPIKKVKQLLKKWKQVFKKNLPLPIRILLTILSLAAAAALGILVLFIAFQKDWAIFLLLGWAGILALLIIALIKIWKKKK